MTEEPTEEEIRQRQGCAEGFFSALGCSWFLFGCLVLMVLPLGSKV